MAGSENGREDIAGGRLTELLIIHFRSGLTVLTTCSPRNFDLVRSRGADHIFDYSDRDSVSKIKQLTNNDLAYIFDCVGEGSAPNFCYEAMGRKGGKYATVAPPQPSSRIDIEVRKVTGPTCYGEDYEQKAPDLNMKVPARPEDYALCAQVYETTQKLLAAGELKTRPADVRDGGLRGVPEGLRDMKEGKISGRKLVYKI
jgi:NADPH:quinone reductase-like Zn-dependent oxidoreductase